MNSFLDYCSAQRDWLLEFIEALVAVESPSDDPAAVKAQEKIDTQRATLLRGIPAEILADELERRGWAVIPPA